MTNPQSGLRTETLCHRPTTLKENCSQLLYYSSLAKEIWDFSTPINLFKIWWHNLPFSLHSLLSLSQSISSAGNVSQKKNPIALAVSLGFPLCNKGCVSHLHHVSQTLKSSFLMQSFRRKRCFKALKASRAFKVHLSNKSYNACCWVTLRCPWFCLSFL